MKDILWIKERKQTDMYQLVHIYIVIWYSNKRLWGWIMCHDVTRVYDCMCVQVCWSPVTWSSPCVSARARPSTTCGLNGLALSKPAHRSARCLTLPACLVHNWSSTQTWACGMELLSLCSTTWTDRLCCCMVRRHAPSDTHPRSGL